MPLLCCRGIHFSVAFEYHLRLQSEMLSSVFDVSHDSDVTTNLTIFRLESESSDVQTTNHCSGVFSCKGGPPTGQSKGAGT